MNFSDLKIGQLFTLRNKAYVKVSLYSACELGGKPKVEVMSGCYFVTPIGIREYELSCNGTKSS